jgi:hypothetical protein
MADDDQQQCLRLHKEFQATILVLTLVTCLNNGGHPVLKQSFRAKYQGTFDRTQPNKSIALNAIAAMLVRNTEVIAAAPQDFPIIVTDTPHDILSLDRHEHEDCILNENDWQPKELGELGESLSSGFATVANPDYNDKHYDREAPGHCVMAQPGISHWPSIRADGWFGLGIA